MLFTCNVENLKKNVIYNIFPMIFFRNVQFTGIEKLVTTPQIIIYRDKVFQYRKSELDYFPLWTFFIIFLFVRLNLLLFLWDKNRLKIKIYRKKEKNVIALRIYQLRMQNWKVYWSFFCAFFLFHSMLKFFLSMLDLYIQFLLYDAVCVIAILHGSCGNFEKIWCNFGKLPKNWRRFDKKIEGNLKRK